MFQILTTADPTITNWSRWSVADQSDLREVCADKKVQDNHENDDHNLNTDGTATTNALLNSSTAYNTADLCEDNQNVPSTNTEFLSSLRSSRIRDSRKISLGVISEVFSVEHVSENNDSGVCSGMAQLKATTARLKLVTRRPSYVAWQAQIQQRPKNLISQENLTNDILTEERKNWITNAFQWITEELTDMRHQDQDLARQLLSIRQEIQRIKLNMSCEYHEDMLTDVQLEMEELEELSEICDQLPPVINDNPLRHLGVTRMNISARRFSTC